MVKVPFGPKEVAEIQKMAGNDQDAPEVVKKTAPRPAAVTRGARESASRLELVWPTQRVRETQRTHGPRTEAEQRKHDRYERNKETRLAKRAREV